MSPGSPYGAHYARLPLVAWEGILRDDKVDLLLNVWAAEIDEGTDQVPVAPCEWTPTFLRAEVAAERQAVGIRALRLVESCRDGVLPRAGTRLIGANAAAGASHATLNLLALTRAKVEGALGGRSWAVVGVPIEDRVPGHAGTYTVYVLIERVP